MELDTDEIDPRTAYRIVSGVVVPRPIGWISTRSADGVDNLAPFSYYNAVSSHPPVVMFSAGTRSDGASKDTPKNAVETGEFVANLVTEALVERMDMTSAGVERDESEFEFANLERAESVTVTPPRVADAAVCFECSLYKSLRVYDNTVILGEVKYIYLDDELLTDGELDVTKIDAIGRLGGPYYTRIDRLDFERSY